MDIQTSTPKAKHFIQRILAADFFDPAKVSINVRQPRSIVSGENVHDVTVPLEEPGTDLFEELWQFSEVISLRRRLVKDGAVDFKEKFLRESNRMIALEGCRSNGNGHNQHPQKFAAVKQNHNVESFLCQGK